jgi:type II secretory pathway component GspD/PulD (secretin)/tetratricopeptide (TPR) repeat protein
MTSAAKTCLPLAFLLAISSVQAQTIPPVENPVEIANDEAVRRQEATIRMHHTLEQARDALQRKNWADAAKFYQEAVADIPFAQVGSAAVDAEKREAVAGLDNARATLARQALVAGDMIEANTEIDAALKVDPSNEVLRHLKAEIMQRQAEQIGTVPSPDILKRLPGFQQQRIDIATRVQNAKTLYEMGKYAEAEAILVLVVKDDPSNRSAPYYLDLIKEARYMDSARRREEGVKSSIGNVESSWIESRKRENLPIPNPMYDTNLVYTTKGRQYILSKLNSIILNEVSFDLTLKDVLVKLRTESQKRDPDGVGINFMINPNVEGPTPFSTDTTGAVPPAGGAQQKDIGAEVNIKISPPLSNLRLADVLDAVQKVADSPIRFTVEDYAVVFSPKPPEPIPGLELYTKTFKVDPNTFVQGLQNVTAISLNFGTQSAGGGGAGGGGGGGGQSGGGGGGTSGGQQSIGGTIPQVAIAATVQGGQQGGAGGGGVGQQGPGGRQIGLSYVTRTNSTEEAHQMVAAYFAAAGVNLAPPKTVFFNDRLGELLVRATLADLDIIQRAIEMLNQTPPQVTVEAKFADLTQEDARGLGFQWYLGNTLMNNGAIGLQGGTAPSYQGPTSQGNPSGIFPGPGSITPGSSSFSPGPGAIPASATDNVLTQGLRNEVGSGLTQLPTLGTITGIMTDPQFRVAIQAIEQRTGSDLLAAPKVTTESGRQAHLAAQDLVTIVSSVTLNTATGGGGGLTSAPGVATQSPTYNTTFLALGPSLDVIPTVSADGYSIQMALLPTFTEFIGYDNPGQFVNTAVSATSSSFVSVTATLPLPHFRIRSVATTCDVWDGQTVVLGGLISETIYKIHDKVPFMGDLPFFGKLFQSQSSDSTKENLLIFVTATIIDPAGNRVHNEDDLPFAKFNVPPQPAPATPATPGAP